MWGLLLKPEMVISLVEALCSSLLLCCWGHHLLPRVRVGQRSSGIAAGPCPLPGPDTVAQAGTFVPAVRARDVEFDVT